MEENIDDRYSMYRKWASGLLEVWISTSHTVTINVPWGALYRSTTCAGKSYPSKAKFIDVPIVVMTAKTDAGDAAWFIQTEGEVTNRTPNYMFLRPDKFDRTALMLVSSYSIGRWK